MAQATFVQLKIKSDVGEFTAPINPASFKSSLNNNYTREEKSATNSVEIIKFISSSPETVSFDLMLDDTGIAYPIQEGKNDVISQIKKFKEVVCNYDGNVHKAPPVELIWSDNFKHKDISFKWVLMSMQISYSLFAPSGKPIRAKLSLSFKGNYNHKERYGLEGKSSPDMTHYREVGTKNISMWCEEIYGDSTLYPKIAAINGLDNFRNIKAGTTLMFPPLIK